MEEPTIHKNNNLIPEWCTHGKARETYFEYRFYEGRHFWWCTHGGWEFESDNSGKVLDSWFHNEEDLKHLRNLKIDKFFNREEYMEEFGKENEYEY